MFMWISEILRGSGRNVGCNLENPHENCRKTKFFKMVCTQVVSMINTATLQISAPEVIALSFSCAHSSQFSNMGYSSMNTCQHSRCLAHHAQRRHRLNLAHASSIPQRSFWTSIDTGNDIWRMLWPLCLAPTFTDFLHIVCVWEKIFRFPIWKFSGNKNFFEIFLQLVSIKNTFVMQISAANMISWIFHAMFRVFEHISEGCTQKFENSLKNLQKKCWVF